MLFLSPWYAEFSVTGCLLRFIQSVYMLKKSKKLEFLNIAACTPDGMPVYVHQVAGGESIDRETVRWCYSWDCALLIASLYKMYSSRELPGDITDSIADAFFELTADIEYAMSAAIEPLVLLSVLANVPEFLPYISYIDPFCVDPAIAHKRIPTSDMDNFAIEEKYRAAAQLKCIFDGFRDSKRE